MKKNTTINSRGSLEPRFSSNIIAFPTVRKSVSPDHGELVDLDKWLKCGKKNVMLGSCYGVFYIVNQDTGECLWEIRQSNEWAELYDPGTKNESSVIAFERR